MAPPIAEELAFNDGGRYIVPLLGEEPQEEMEADSIKDNSVPITGLSNYKLFYWFEAA